MRIFPLLLCVVGMLTTARCADAGALYAATAGAQGELYVLDPTTGGVLRNVGLLNDAAGRNYPVTGLAFHPVTGALFGSTHDSPVADSATVSRLVSINTVTAEVTVIGEFNIGNAGTPATMTDIAFVPGGALFGIASVGNPQIYSVDIHTGKADPWQGPAPGPPTTVAGGGLATVDSFTHYLTPTVDQFSHWYLVPGGPRPGHYYETVGNTAKPAGGGNYGALDFDGDVLYGLNVGPGSPPQTHLVRINTSTGEVTDIGRSVDGLEAIAFIPEPASWLLVALASATFLLIGAQRNRTRPILTAVVTIVFCWQTPTSADATEYSFINIADTTSAAPSGTFESFDERVAVSGSTVSFLGRYSGGEGIYIGNGGPLSTVAKTGDPAPSGTFSGFSSPSIDGSAVAFSASYTGGSGVFIASGGALTTVAKTGDIVPSTSRAFNRVGTPAPAISGGIVAFNGGWGDFDAGIFLGSGGPLTTIARTGDAAPGGTLGSTTGHHPLTISGSSVAFLGFLNGAGAIFTASGGPITKIAFSGQSTLAGVILGFNGPDIPSISGDTVAFKAEMGSGRDAIFMGNGGQLTSVVKTGDTVPVIGTISHTASPSISGNTVAFLATRDFPLPPPTGHGIFVRSGDGPIEKVVVEGESLFGSTVTSLIGRFNLDAGGSGNLAFSYELADGREGVALAYVIPEPATWLLAALTCAAVLIIGLRRKLQRPFLTTVVATGFCVWSSTAADAAEYSFINIADTSTPAPNGTFTSFDSFSRVYLPTIFPPAISGTNVAFVASYDGGNQSGVFRTSGGSLTTIAKSGDLAPHDVFRAFNHPAINGDMVAFEGGYGNIDDDPTNGIFMGNGGMLTVIAREGDPAPSGSFGEICCPAFNGNAVGFRAYWDFFGIPGYYHQRGIFTGTGGSLTSIATSTSSVHAPAFSDGTAAFGGSFDGVSGVFSVTGGTTSIIARLGDTTPSGVQFNGRFNDPVAISNGTVVFGGFTRDQQQAIFSSSGGPLTLIAKQGDPAPTGTFKFLWYGFPSFFEAASISGDTVAFSAKFGESEPTSDFRGIFTSTNGSLATVIKSGDPLFDSTVIEVALGRFGLDPAGSGNMAFTYKLADGREGIAMAVPGFESLPGDYDGNGAVDACDYVVWRNTLGEVGTGLPADGNGNDEIDPNDYGIWRAHFGQTAATTITATSPLSKAIPEPCGIELLILAVLVSTQCMRGKRLRHGFSILAGIVAIFGSSTAGAAGYSFINVADTTMAAPSGTFSSFQPLVSSVYVDPPALSGSNVAFVAAYNNGDQSGVFRGSGGPLTTIAKTGDIAPQNEFREFNSPAINGEMVAFQGGYGSTGIFMGNGGLPTAIVTQGDPVPASGFGFGTSFYGVGYPAFNGSAVGFRANIYYSIVAGPYFGIFSGAGGPLTTVVLTENRPPALDTILPGTPAFSNGTVAYATSNGRVFTRSGGTTTTIAQPGDSTLSGIKYYYRMESMPVAISGDTVVFWGFFLDLNNPDIDDNAIFAGSGGPLSVIVKRGDAAPIGTFDGFGQSYSPSISGATVAFTAFFGDYQYTGIFTNTDGLLATVVKSGDPLFGSTVTDLTMGRFGLDPGGSGNLAFTYKLADGREGVALARAVLESVPGDYDGNGTVDASDYVVWRSTLGNLGSGLAADGNGNDVIDSGDYDVWRAHFGQTAATTITASSPLLEEIPEPTGVALLIVALLALLCFRGKCVLNGCTIMLMAAVVIQAPSTVVGASYSFINVADTTMAAPSGTFNDFLSEDYDPPAISGTNVAFIANYDGDTRSGMFRGSSRQLTTIANSGDVALGGAGAFHEPAIHGEMVAFGIGYDPYWPRGIFMGNGAALTKIVKSGDRPPGVSGYPNFVLFDSPGFNGDAVGFWGSFSVGKDYDMGIFEGTGSPLNTLILDGYDFVYSPAFSNGTVAFEGQAPNSSLGVFRRSGDPTTPIYRYGDPISGIPMYPRPGAPTRLSISGDTVVFAGQSGPGEPEYFEAIVAGDGGTPRLIAKTGDPAPTGTFRSFLRDSWSGENPSISGDTIVFSASYGEPAHPAENGIFTSRNGVLATVIKSGDPLFDSTITDVMTGRFAIDPEGSGNLAFTYKLADGREGVALARAILSSIPGDYDGNGVVEACDYVVWRNTLGEIGTGLPADGNGNDEIDLGDYALWRAHFGQSAANDEGIPEPATIAMLGLALIALTGGALRRKQRVVRKTMTISAARTSAVCRPPFRAAVCGGLLLGLAAVHCHAQTLEWVRQLGGTLTEPESSWGVSADGLGSVYIVGSGGFGESSITNTGQEDAFLSKFDAAGQQQWTQRIETDRPEIANGVSADGLGNVYIAGWMMAGWGEREGDAYVSKYDTAGALQWTQQFGTNEFDGNRGVSADSLGNIYVVGETWGQLEETNPPPPYNNPDAFIRKYDAAGVHQWTRQFGTTSQDFGMGVAVDGLGNVFIAGATGYSNAYIKKYNTVGDLEWTQQLGAGLARAVSADNLGNVYVSGQLNGGNTDAFLSKFDTAGKLQWTQQFGSSSYYDLGYGVSADGLGNAFVTGVISTDIGSREAFLSKYDAAGILKWTKLGPNQSSGVSADGDGNIYVSGTVFIRPSGPDIRVDPGDRDPFLAKYIDCEGCEPPPIPPIVVDTELAGEIHPGTIVSHQFTTSFGDLPVVWSNLTSSRPTVNLPTLSESGLFGWQTSKLDGAGIYFFEVTATNAGGSDTGRLTLRLQLIPEPSTVSLMWLGVCNSLIVLRARRTHLSTIGSSHLPRKTTGRLIINIILCGGLLFGVTTNVHAQTLDWVRQLGGILIEPESGLGVSADGLGSVHNIGS